MTMHKLTISALFIITTVSLLPRWQADAVRVKLFPEVEPDTVEMYKSYRKITGDPERYSQKVSNDSLQEEDVSSLVEDAKVNAKYMNSRNDDVEFNSGDYVQGYLELQYFIPYSERAALQVYDDARDRDLAAGPQVNQELCGLQLDYMNHMAQKHRSHVMNSTEYSIFKIMNTYDWPHHGLTKANNYYLGDYGGCRNVQLNVMKEELAKVNKSAAELYFGGSHNVPEERKSLLQWVADNLGPFVGSMPRESQEKIETMRRSKDKLRALPMKYCMAGVRWPSWMNTSHHQRNVVLRTAVCLPETCDSNSLKLHGEKIKKLTDLQSNDFSSGYYISDLYCLPDEQSELRSLSNYPSALLFILFNVIWIALTVLVMVFRPSGKYLDCWSLKKNWNDFWATKKNKEEDANENPRQNFATLEGLKIFASLMVLSAHSYAINIGTTWNAAEGHDVLKQSYVVSLLTICPTAVDIFFVMTGVITINSLLAKSRSSLKKPSFWIGFIVYRYIRIIPLYALVHWFLQSGFRFLGSGPLWDYGTSHSAWSKICQNESWLDIFLPRANYKSPNNTCNAVGWYLANDIQFTLITPFIIALYAAKPRLAQYVTCSSIVALVINHVRYYIPFMAGARNVFQWDLMTFTSVLHETTDGYVNPQYRIVAYLIGLAAGYMLYEYGQDKSSRWPKSLIFAGKIWLYLSIYLLCFMPFLSTLVPLDNEPLIKSLAPVMLGTMHFTASISAAIFILLICTGHYSKQVTALFSWPGFKPLANASLSIVLVQLPLILYHTQSITTLPELSRYYLLSSLVIWCLETCLLATAVHILYEVPMKRFLVKFMLNIFANDKPQVAATEPNGKMKVT